MMGANMQQIIKVIILMADANMGSEYNNFRLICMLNKAMFKNTIKLSWTPHSIQLSHNFIHHIKIIIFRESPL